MTKTKKILLAVGAAVLVVCLALVLAFCGKPGSGEPDTTPDAHEGEIWTFTVQLTAEGGAPLEGIGVYVYEDQEQTELTWFDKTDANGMISFTAPVKDGTAMRCSPMCLPATSLRRPTPSPVRRTCLC